MADDLERTSRITRAIREELDEYLATVDDPLVRNALELVPTVGGLLSAAVSQAGARRAARQLTWLSDLQTSTGLSVEAFADAMAEDPVLQACFDSALAGAGEAETTERRRALRQVMRRAIAGEDAVEVSYFHVSTLRGLTPAHLDVLRIVAERQQIDPPSMQVREEPDHPEFLAYTLEVLEANTTSSADILDRFPGVEPVLDAILGGLSSSGLIEDLANKGYETEPQRWLRTGYGLRLLRDLSDE